MQNTDSSNNGKPSQIYINMKMRRDYGGMSIEFEEGYFMDWPVSPDQRRSAMDGLTLSLADQHQHFVRHMLPQLAKMGIDPNPGQYDVFEADSISVEVKGGKPYYKVHGGRWQKWGVSIWPEVLDETGLKEQLGNNTSMTLKGWTARALMVDGKPKKIVAMDQS